MMTLQEIVALYSGLAYLAAAGVGIPIVKILGPAFPSRITAPGWMIAVGAAYTVLLFFRAMTILFPGQLVAVQDISWVTPLKATGDLVLMVVLLDCVLRWRSPPPLIARGIEIARRWGLPERGLVEMAFASPSLAIADAPATEDANAPEVGKRAVRIAVIAAAVAVIVGIVVVVIVNSAAASTLA